MLVVVLDVLKNLVLVLVRHLVVRLLRILLETLADTELTLQQLNRFPVLFLVLLVTLGPADDFTLLLDICV